MQTIGICIPTYKRESQLGALLDSIPPHIATYVSDNAATLSLDFKARYPGVRFDSLEGEPIPMFANWNRAAKLSTEDWILIPSDDDIYLPDSFPVIEAALRKHAERGMVIFGHYFVDDQYVRIGDWCPPFESVHEPGAAFERFSLGVPARMPSIAFKRTLLEQVGYFDENLRITAADSYLIQHALLTASCAFIPTRVSGYRIWKGSATDKTIGTDQWLVDVDYWGTKIEEILRRQGATPVKASQTRDQLYAVNMAAGLSNLRHENSATKVWRYFENSRFPHNAKFGTKLLIVAQLLRSLATTWASSGPSKLRSGSR